MCLHKLKLNFEQEYAFAKFYYELSCFDNLSCNLCFITRSVLISLDQ